MEELNNEEILKYPEQEKVITNTNIFQSQTNKSFAISKGGLIAHPNPKFGKGMKATQQTVKPPKPRKGK